MVKESYVVCRSVSRWPLRSRGTLDWYDDLKAQEIIYGELENLQMRKPI